MNSPAKLLVPLFVLLGAGVAVDRASAQQPLRITVTPTLSLLDPHGDVPRAPILDDGVLGYDDFASTGALGVALEVASGSFPLGLRAGVSRSLSFDETGQWSCTPGADGACPDILIRVPTDVTLTSLALDLVGRLPLGPVGLHPSVGAAWVRYAYSWNAQPLDVFSLEPGEASSAAFGVRVGFGLSVAVGTSARLRADWHELIAGGDDARARPRRLSVLSLGTELALGR